MSSSFYVFMNSEEIFNETATSLSSFSLTLMKTYNIKKSPLKNVCQLVYHTAHNYSNDQQICNISGSQSFSTPFAGAGDRPVQNMSRQVHQNIKVLKCITDKT